MFGAKYENEKIIVLEGTKEELNNKGFAKAFATRDQAEDYGRMLRYLARKKELMKLLPNTPGRLSELVCLVGEDEDGLPGSYYASMDVEMSCNDTLEAWEKANGITPPTPPEWPSFPPQTNDAGEQILFYPKFEDDTASVVSGTESELKAMGYDPEFAYGSETEAEIRARDMEIKTLLKEWDALTDFTTARAWELERRLFSSASGWIPGGKIAWQMKRNRFLTMLGIDERTKNISDMIDRNRK